MKALKLLILVAIMQVLAACSGSDDESSDASNNQDKGLLVPCSTCPNPTPLPTSSFAPLEGNLVTISGRVTYDRVPHVNGASALDYDSIIIMPVRGANVLLLDASGAPISKTKTNADGDYQIQAPENEIVQVRVMAEMQKAGAAPTWDFSVTDNTQGNAVYGIQGSLVTAGDVDSSRDLHAPSGWTGDGYGEPRAAAPFAILDSVYGALELIIDADSQINLPPMELRWSVNNIAAMSIDLDRSTGLIGTSLYDPSENNIYILGDENNDTDEYDASVVLHEFVHYLEDSLSRSDSIGGSHPLDSRLDMRLVYSEGLANALSGAFGGTSLYRDSALSGQAGGFTFSLETRFNRAPGWFSERSVHAFVYDLFDDENEIGDELSLGFAPILDVLTSDDFINHPSLITVFSFSSELAALNPELSSEITNMLNFESIFGEGYFGENEVNDGGNAFTLPVYKNLILNMPIRVCTNNRERDFSGLGVSSFLRLNITDTGNYRITAESDGTGTGVKDPDFIIFRNGIASRDLVFQNNSADRESGEAFLEQGEYVIEIYDWANRDNNDATGGTACFDVVANRI